MIFSGALIIGGPPISDALQAEGVIASIKDTELSAML
jgi:hypothetical protein